VALNARVQLAAFYLVGVLEVEVLSVAVGGIIPWPPLDHSATPSFAFVISDGWLVDRYSIALFSFTMIEPTEYVVYGLPKVVAAKSFMKILTAVPELRPAVVRSGVTLGGLKAGGLDTPVPFDASVDADRRALANGIT
jgi:hypothetical protein